MIAIAYANGVIEFARKTKPETLPITSAPAARLRKVVSGLARHADDGKTLLVPGMPEATCWDERCEALFRFTAAVKKGLGRPALARRIAEFDARRAT